LKWFRCTRTQGFVGAGDGFGGAAEVGFGVGEGEAEETFESALDAEAGACGEQDAVVRGGGGQGGGDGGGQLGPQGHAAGARGDLPVGEVGGEGVEQGGALVAELGAALGQDGVGVFEQVGGGELVHHRGAEVDGG